MTNKGSTYKKEQRYYYLLLVVGIVCAGFVFVVSLCLGNYQTTPTDVLFALTHPEADPQIYMIVMRSRLPRLLAAVLVGASLSVAGITYQDIFSNRMASPDLLGVSAGAGVGASISIYLGFSFWITGVFAFIGGIAAVCLTVGAAKLFEGPNRSVASLILAGIVVGGLMKKQTR